MKRASYYKEKNEKLETLKEGIILVLVYIMSTFILSVASAIITFNIISFLEIFIELHIFMIINVILGLIISTTFAIRLNK